LGIQPLASRPSVAIIAIIPVPGQYKSRKKLIHALKPSLKYKDKKILRCESTFIKQSSPEIREGFMDKDFWKQRAPAI
jgi:hypothetical protein